jgi:hypothetical protein
MVEQRQRSTTARTLGAALERNRVEHPVGRLAVAMAAMTTRLRELERERESGRVEEASGE